MVYEMRILAQSSVRVNDKVELRTPAGRKANPLDKQGSTDPGLIASIVNEIHDLITDIVGDPTAGQTSPSSFF
jgi:hypothetical protein